jgi:hypothetical protein
MSDITDPVPFPAEADLAAVAQSATGPVGRFQIVCSGLPKGGVAAFLIDTTDGRSWSFDGESWTPLPYSMERPEPAP